MASTASVAVRSRRLWLLTVANWLCPWLPRRWRHAVALYAWRCVVFEIRNGGSWHRLSQPELRLED